MYLRVGWWIRYKEFDVKSFDVGCTTEDEALWLIKQMLREDRDLSYCEEDEEEE